MFETLTKKRILYRQKKLSDMLNVENKRKMDYFYIEQEQPHNH